MRISANQWRTSVLKACVGAYVARGVAEDIADACLALLELGQDPLPVLLPLIEKFDGSVQPAEWQARGGVYAASSTKVLMDGPSIFDLAEAGKTVRCSVDEGLMTFALMAARMKSHDVLFDLVMNGDQIKNMTSVQFGPAEIVVRLSTDSKTREQPAHAFPVPNENDWIRLQKLADEILVPADDTNRADAGAGLTDND